MRLLDDLAKLEAQYQEERHKALQDIKHHMDNGGIAILNWDAAGITVHSQKTGEALDVNTFLPSRAAGELSGQYAMRCSMWIANATIGHLFDNGEHIRTNNYLYVPPTVRARIQEHARTRLVGLWNDDVLYAHLLGDDTVRLYGNGVNLTTLLQLAAFTPRPHVLRGEDPLEYVRNTIDPTRELTKDLT